MDTTCGTSPHWRRDSVGLACYFLSCTSSSYYTEHMSVLLLRPERFRLPWASFGFFQKCHLSLVTFSLDSSGRDFPRPSSSYKFSTYVKRSPPAPFTGVFIPRDSCLL